MKLICLGCRERKDVGNITFIGAVNWMCSVVRIGNIFVHCAIR